MRPALDDAYMSGQIACLLVLGKLWALGAQPASVVLCAGEGDDLDPALMERMLDGAQAACADAAVACERGQLFPSAAPQLAISAAALAPTIIPAPLAPGAALYLLGQLGAGALVAAGQRASATLALSNARAARLGPQLVRVASATLAPSWRDGLLGQLVALCRAADVDAQIWTSALPAAPELDGLIGRGVRPRGEQEIWERFGAQVRLGHDRWRGALCDPLPCGLLVAAPISAQPLVERLWGEPVQQIGQVMARVGGGARVSVLQQR